MKLIINMINYMNYNKSRSGKSGFSIEIMIQFGTLLQVKFLILIIFSNLLSKKSNFINNL